MLSQNNVSWCNSFKIEKIQRGIIHVSNAPSNKKMRMEHWRNKNGKRKRKLSEKNRSHLKVAHNIPHTEWPRIKPGLRREGSATNRLSLSKTEIHLNI